MPTISEIQNEMMKLKRENEVSLSDIIKPLLEKFHEMKDDEASRVAINWSLSKHFNSQKPETQRQINAILFPNQK